MRRIADKNGRVFIGEIQAGLKRDWQDNGRDESVTNTSLRMTANRLAAASERDSPQNSPDRPNGQQNKIHETI